MTVSGLAHRRGIEVRIGLSLKLNTFSYGDKMTTTNTRVVLVKTFA
jgi:hypothetical protein